jgi:hypothetical protein
MPDPTVERPPLSELVDRALSADARRLQKLLASIYADPPAVREAFRHRAAVVGPQPAGSEMAQNPASFGALRPLVPEAHAGTAREAGYVAGLAYLLQANRENPPVAAKLLTQRFYQASRAVFEDVPLMYRNWAEAVRRDGAATAASRLEAEPQSFAPLRQGGDRFAQNVAARGLDAEHARAHAAAHEVEHNATAILRRPRLPRTVHELENRHGGRLPRPLEIRLEAFSFDFRGKLAAAYMDPELAEAAFHHIGNREGFQATVLAVRRSPQLLGPLTDDPNAAEIAYAAARRGARAYELNAISNPAHAADLLHRETQASLARQCSNPADALRRIEAAMRERGVGAVSAEIQSDPLRYFAPLADRTMNPSALAAEARALGEATRAAGQYVSEATARLDAPRSVRDLPVGGTAADALQAHADATLLSTRKGDLHEVLNEAANALRRVERAEKWHEIRLAQLRTALREIYASPADAEAALIDLADRRGPKEAARHLEKKPQALGILNANRRTARAAAADAAIHATNYFDARAARTDVQYKDRDGHIHRGVENVRAATTREIGTSSADLTDTQRQLSSLGDVEGTRARAIHVVQGLSPEQADQLVTALQQRNPHAAQPLQIVRDTAAARREGGDLRRESMLPSGSHHTVLQAAQLVRSAAEGPTM